MPLTITPGVVRIGESGDQISGSVLLAEGSNVTITRSGQTITIASSGGGGGVSIGDTITGGTDGSVLYLGTSNVLAQDNSNFFYDSSNTRLRVPDIAGGTTSSSFLKVRAHTAAFDNQNTGRINVYDPIDLFPDNLSLTNVNAGFVNLAQLVCLNIDCTIDGTPDTAGRASNSINITGYSFAPTVLYDSSQSILAAAVTFASAPVIQPVDTAVSDGNQWTGFNSLITFKPDLSTAITATTANVNGFSAAPRIEFESGSHASAAAVITNWSGVKIQGLGLLGAAIASGCTITNVRHFYAVSNVYGSSSGTLTNQIALDIENFDGGTNLWGIRSALNSGATKYFIQSTGTAVSAFTGGIRIGDSSQPTQKLEVLGNVLLDNGGTASELRFREPSASGSNYSGFNAAAQSFDVIYTFPTTAPTAGQVLSAAAPSGGYSQLSWTTSSGGASTTTKYTTADQSVNNGTTGTTLVDVTSLTGFTYDATSYYKVEGVFFVTADDAAPDIKIAFVFDSAPTAFRFVVVYCLNASSTDRFEEFTTSGSSTGFNLTSAGGFFKLKGYFNSNASGTDLKVQFAQNSSSASNTTFRKGSWMTVTKMS